MEPLLERAVSFGESVEIPDTNEPLWAEIDVPLSVAGRAASLLACVPQISLHLRSKGQDRQYRFLADTARGISAFTSDHNSGILLFAPPGSTNRRRPATARGESGAGSTRGACILQAADRNSLFRLLIHW
jgi:hypothetical protein